MKFHSVLYKYILKVTYTHASYTSDIPGVGETHDKKFLYGKLFNIQKNWSHSSVAKKLIFFGGDTVGSKWAPLIPQHTSRQYSISRHVFTRVTSVTVANAYVM
jgi:hypothetical protein